MAKDNRIKSYYERVSVYFTEIEENKRSIVESLLQNYAFMSVALQDLQKKIMEEGMTEGYQNGEHQHGIKQSASMQAYNSMIKNYTLVIKQMIQFLPEGVRSGGKLEAFIEQVNSSKN